MKLPVVLLAGVLTTAMPAMAAEHPRIRQDVEHLLAICAAHPGFRAVSIDAFDPHSAPAYAKDFYATARRLHARPRSLDVIAGMRSGADAKTATCLDQVVATWPQ